MKHLILVITALTMLTISSCTIDNKEQEGSKTETVKDSEQPLCCNLTIEENGNQVVYKFSCCNMVITETENGKYLSFFYIDGSSAYNFHIDNIMNGSNVYYAPDCD